MGIRGIVIGGCVGSLFGGGPIGAIFGALAGHQIEKRIVAGRRISSRRVVASQEDPLLRHYRVLGSYPSDSNDVLKRRYRELAKANHPDAIRSAGLSESEVHKASERMVKINAAWNAVKKERGI